MSISTQHQLANPASSLVVAAGLVCSAFFFPTFTVSATEDPSVSVKTVGGVLRVVSEPFPPHLVLNKNKIPGIENDLITLKQKFKVAGNDVVLVHHNCSGSSCGGASTLNFVTVAVNGKVNVSEDIAADEDGTVDVKAVGDTLVVKTETFEGRRKKTSTWTYANGKVVRSK